MEVEVYLSSENTSSADFKHTIGTAKVTSLGIGEKKLLKFDARIPQLESKAQYYLISVIKMDGKIATEKIESSRYTVIVGPKPVVTRVVKIDDASGEPVEDRRLAAGEKYRVAVRVKNRGDESASSFKLEAYLSPDAGRLMSKNPSYETLPAIGEASVSSTLSVNQEREEAVEVEIPMAQKGKQLFLGFDVYGANGRFVSETEFGNDRYKIIGGSEPKIVNLVKITKSGSSATTRKLEIGTAYDLTVKVKNFGDDNSGNLKLNAHLSSDRSLSYLDIPISNDTEVLSLSGNQTRDVKVRAETSTWDREGAFYLIFELSKDEQVVSEWSSSSQYTVSKPVDQSKLQNLIVTGLTVSDEDGNEVKQNQPLMTGQTYTVTVEASNIGEESIENPFKIGLFWSSGDTPPDLIEEKRLSSLLGSSPSVRSFDIQVPRSFRGNKSLIAVVDVDQEIQEGEQGEKDNTEVKTFGIIEASSLDDLNIQVKLEPSDHVWDPRLQVEEGESLIDGQNYKVRVVLENKGVVQLSNAKTTVFWSNNKESAGPFVDISRDVRTLRRNESITQEWNRRLEDEGQDPLDKGEVFLIVFVSSGPNKKRLVQRYNLVERQADLVITDVKVMAPDGSVVDAYSGGKVTQGFPYSVKATIKNQGGRKSASFTVKTFFVPASSDPFSVSLPTTLYSSPVASLEVGESISGVINNVFNLVDFPPAAFQNAPPLPRVFLVVDIGQKHKRRTLEFEVLEDPFALFCEELQRFKNTTLREAIRKQREKIEDAYKSIEGYRTLQKDLEELNRELRFTVLRGKVSIILHTTNKILVNLNGIFLKGFSESAVASISGLALKLPFEMAISGFPGGEPVSKQMIIKEVTSTAFGIGLSKVDEYLKARGKPNGLGAIWGIYSAAKDLQDFWEAKTKGHLGRIDAFEIGEETKNKIYLQEIKFALNAYIIALEKLHTSQGFLAAIEDDIDRLCNRDEDFLAQIPREYDRTAVQMLEDLSFPDLGLGNIELRPDLRITSIKITDSRNRELIKATDPSNDLLPTGKKLQEGEDYEVQVTVENKGQATASSFEMNVYFEVVNPDNPQMDFESLHERTKKNLSLGKKLSQTLSFEFRVPSQAEIKSKASYLNVTVA